MGVWATGLFSGDFALDLRSTIGAVAKLPFDSDHLLEILCESERAAADKPEDPDHTTFWLVVADQFARRGIESERAKQVALEIIDSNIDLAVLEKLGMNAADLRKRKKVLDEVRRRIISPAPKARPREVMRKPQELLMHTGDVLAYPTFGGRCRNPYFVDQERDRRGTATPAWRIDSWAAIVIIDCGRAFDFLAWYRPLVLTRALSDKPSYAALQGDLCWRLARPGTCSPPHFKRMGFEKIGEIIVDPDKLRTCFGELRPGTSAAVGDISIANQISAAPYLSANLLSLRRGKQDAEINGLAQIAES